MATTQLGTDLEIGVGTTMGSYIVESITVDDDDVKQSDINDEDGVLKTRLIKQVMDKITLSLIAISGATPASDFVKGAISGVAPLSDYFIESVSTERTEDAMRVTVTGVNLGIT